MKIGKIAVGYRNWVEDQIGYDQLNGLYLFTAYFAEDPPEATELYVGDYTVAVTNDEKPDTAKLESSWTFTGPVGVVTNGNGLIAEGVATGPGTCTAVFNAVTDGRCYIPASATGETAVIMASVEVLPWLGLDMTDASGGGSVVIAKGALSSRCPSVPNPAVTWSVSGPAGCSVVPPSAGEELFSVSVTSAPPHCSSSYLGETVTMAVSHPAVSVSTNFTVVKVDVEIDGLSEEDEERVGGFAGYAPDNEAGIITSAGTNAMLSVRFACEPRDLPENETVKISHTGNSGELYICEERELHLIDGVTNLPACQIASMRFVFHGHTPSDTFQDNELKIEHENSGSVDKAKATVVKAELVGYAAWRKSENSEVPENERYNPGYLVTADNDGGSHDPLEAKLKFKSVPGGGYLSRYFRFGKGGLILLSGNATSAEEIYIPGENDCVTGEVTMATPVESVWGEDNTYIDVEYIVKYEDRIISVATNRLLRPYIVAIGDSLTYGFMQRRNGANLVLLTPRWDPDKQPRRRVWRTSSYPSDVDWNSISLNSSPPPSPRKLHYQGYRGYVTNNLPGFTWLGINPNGHGPRHNGFPGSTIGEMFAPTQFNQLLLDKCNSAMIVIFLGGMNDCNTSRTIGSTAALTWEKGLGIIVKKRLNKGKTWVLPLFVPQISSDKQAWTLYQKRDYKSVVENISFLNCHMERKAKSASVPSAHVFVRLFNSKNIPHDEIDDCMHYCSDGYLRIADKIMETLKGVLGEL